MSKQTRRRARPAPRPQKQSRPPVVLPPKEVLDRLPDDLQIVAVEAAAFTGPLPPPSMFNHYNEVLPGSAERILRMAEKEQEHRTTWESEVLRVGARDSLIGQALGFLALLVCVGGAIYLALSGNVVVAVVLVGAPIVGTIGLVYSGAETAWRPFIEQLRRSDHSDCSRFGRHRRVRQQQQCPHHTPRGLHRPDNERRDPGDGHAHCS